MSPSTPPDTLFSRSEQARARAAAHANNDPHRSLHAWSALFCSTGGSLLAALWRVVSRRRSPPTTALLLVQQGPLTSPFGQVSRAPDKSVLSVSVQREVPLRPAGSVSQELCHHPSTRTQGWCRQPTERRHGVAAHQQQSREVQIPNPHIGGHPAACLSAKSCSGILDRKPSSAQNPCSRT